VRKVLLSMRVTETESYIEFRNSIAYEYIELLESFGFLVVLVPNNSNVIEQYFDEEVDLVVLSGGNNVDPSLYNGNTNLGDVYPERDKTEKKLFDIAIQQGIKVLGICRGFHAINVFLGGSVSHKVKGHVNQDHKLISNRADLNNQITNSFHNQAITEYDLVGWGKVSLLATSEDGLIEAVINEERTFLGIQWHPERRYQEFDRKLIKNFIKGWL
jgi:gamma-glutamyl-gamma-aminobutyrate hydrolase PuuD